ncbi:uncharacterized protein EV420DRAFT_1654975 [Desarmillaria tabescens]|uniref:Uncharacterized protein n=1 Tax=Armillaria tabescens TaxID=1929756 RepID=A0AA39IZ14_ARMTA|nr:uncharacterized protein EV420DRAFT_1654975 [Desarmillaria tabescens]KAK0433120.1 hypothetical protein EV420DRAFT_1654975 [Desarmillaria tabescens]
MSFTAIRGQCTEHTDNVFCLCLRFTPHRDPSHWLTLDQSRCMCGHGIHAHADYVSLIVHNCRPTHCVAYVQKTPKTQECTCSALLFDHVPVVNAYRSPAAVSYNRGSVVDGDQSIGSPTYTIDAPSSLNDANPVTSIPMIFSPDINAPSRIIQPETDIFATHQLVGHDMQDGDVPNGNSDYDPNTLYPATPGAEAWVGPYSA